MGRNSVIPIALRTIDRVIGALFLLVAAMGQAGAANCDIFSCVSHHDVIPNFAGQPTIRSIQNGAWSSASTWKLGRLANATDTEDVVAIGSGTSVTFDTTDDGIGKFDPRQYGTGRLVIDGQPSIHGALSAAHRVTIRVVK
jgi:hypothetical protein